MDKEFLKNIKAHETILNKKTKSFTINGYIKLVLVLLFLVMLYFTFDKDNGGYSRLLKIGIDVALVIGFSVFTVINSRLRREIDYHKGIILINKRYLKRLDGSWTEFADTGKDFYDPEHQYAGDLDIVGQKSLYQMLNGTSTWHGRKQFAEDLLSPNYNATEILERQKSVDELANELEYGNDMQYYFSKIDSGDSILKLIDEMKNKDRFVKSSLLKLILSILPIITLTTAAIAFISGLSILFTVMGVLIGVQTITWLLATPKTLSYLGAIKEMSYKLSDYSCVIEKIKEKEFCSSKLTEIQSGLSSKDDYSAARAIKELGTISAMLGARSNGLINLLLNVFLLWDIQCSFMLEKWKSRYSDLSEEWFIALGDFESLLSLSVLPHVCSGISFPQISEFEKCFSAASIGHPLILNQSRVCNDIDLQDDILIISGSNMSGKTTFLRTVGVNLVLALAGGYVCAETMNVSIMKPVTSMRIADDLNEGISTFYAELRRVKKIVELAREEENLMFFIDEIFKGTNSKDRLSGAKAVISGLNRQRSVGMITTHDLELCDMSEQYDRIRNYNFAEYYENGKIFFDYKMKPGKSTGTNAKYLMEMVGIFEGV